MSHADIVKLNLKVWRELGETKGLDTDLRLSLKCGYIHQQSCLDTYMNSLPVSYHTNPTDYFPFVQSIYEECKVCAGGPNNGPVRDISVLIARLVQRGPHVHAYMPNIEIGEPNSN